MTNIGILFILVVFVQLLLIVVFRQPKKLFHHKILSKKTVTPAKIILIVCMIILYWLLFIQIEKYHIPQPLVNKPYVHKVGYPTLSPDVVQQVGVRKTSTIVNRYFLYLGQDKSSQTLSDVALRLRDQYCQLLCIINLYDDKTAYDLDIERVNITSNAVMKEWNKKNYVYVADHYLGYLDAVEEAPFTYYPFHDGYYKHAKEGTLEGY
jgi:hypothetical protein